MTTRTVRKGDLLTPREHGILLLRCEGLRRHEIAFHLGLSPDTVKDYDKRIRTKLGGKTMVEAVAIAYHTGILKPKYCRCDS